MSTNLTVESPDFDKIQTEAGTFTSDAISLLWSALNDTRATERRDFRRVRDQHEPKVLPLSPSASVDNLDLQGCSVVSFSGASAQNATGMRAPETSTSRVVYLQVNGAGTITVKHNVTSDSANRIVTSTGADVALSTGKGMVLAYLAGMWRQVV